jgi:hypothetical protein
MTSKITVAVVAAILLGSAGVASAQTANVGPGPAAKPPTLNPITTGTTGMESRLPGEFSSEIRTSGRLF